MLGRRVVGSDGRVWRVRRRWLPWKPRVRTGWGFSVDGAQGGGDAADFFDVFDGPFGIVLTVTFAIVFGVVVAFLFPLLLTAAELLLALVLIPVAVGARLFLGAPWLLVARTPGPPPEQHVLAVAGWRASGDALEGMVTAIATGHAGTSTASRTWGKN